MPYDCCILAAFESSLNRGILHVVSRKRSRARAAGLAIAALAALASCTTATKSASDPTSSTQISDGTGPVATSGAASSSTTSSGEPVIPQAAQANTPGGAEAFTKYFGQVVNQAFVDQNEFSLQSLVSPECRSCSGIVGSILSYRQKGQRFVGQYLAVTAAVFSSDSNGVTKVIASTDQSGGRIIDSKGSLVENAPPSRGNLSVQLKFDGHWRVLEMQGLA